MVHCNHHRHTKGLHILDMATKVRTSRLHSSNIFPTEICLGDTTIHLHCSHRCHQHNHARRNARLAAFNVHEFFGTQIGAKASLGDNIIGQF